jgi:hypothetical protein
MPYEYFSEQLPFAKGRFDHEFVNGRFRIRDSKDDPMGSATTQEEADEMVTRLNRSRGL